MQGAGCRVQGAGFRPQGAGCRVHPNAEMEARARHSRRCETAARACAVDSLRARERESERESEREGGGERERERESERASERESERARNKTEKQFFIDNLLVRIHSIIEMILVDRPCAIGFPVRSTFRGFEASPQTLM